jgi:hypothetical protein
MTLGFYTDFQELFRDVVLWWQGRDETRLGFPIIPNGTILTTYGTWSETWDMGNNVTLKPLLYTATRYMQFSGCNEWALGTGDFTITMWIRVGAIGKEVFPCIWFSEIHGTEYYSILYYDTRAAQGSYRGIRYYAKSVAGTVAVQCSDGDNYATNWQGQWHYLTVTRASGVFTIYKNGIAINSETHETVVVGQADKLNLIGRQILSGSTPFSGGIKDFFLFKGRALTVPEITTIMRLTHPTTGRNDFYPLISPRSSE